MSFASKRMNLRLKFGSDFADKMMELKKEKKEEFNQEMRKTYFQEMRKTYFTPEENLVSVEPQEDGEAMQEGVDVLKKRRGSIFGNNTGTIFGN